MKWISTYSLMCLNTTIIICSLLQADILNNWIVLGVFLISVVNVFISAFGVEPLDGLNPALVRAAVESAAEANPQDILG